MKPASSPAWIVALVIIIDVLTSVSPAEQPVVSNQQAPVQPVRGVWVANVGSPTLASPEGINSFVRLADRCGLNTLYLVVWNRGMTTYPSEIMLQETGALCDPRYQEFDVLRAVIEAAHAKGIRVIAWFEFGFSCSYRQPKGGWILRKHPDWAAIDGDGELVSRNGFQWMNGFHPQVQDFVLALLKEILTRYDVDGVQGDDRLPACPSTAGYDPWTVALYQQQHAGREPPADHLDADWIDWRANLLNQFMERMYRELKAVRPDAVVSTAPSVFPWSKQNYLQDWPTWVEHGWVDEVCPQIYREGVARYQLELEKIVNEQVTAKNLQLVWPGILVQTVDRVFNDAKAIRAMVAANRAAGLQGEVFFYDAALTEQRAFFESLYK